MGSKVIIRQVIDISGSRVVGFLLLGSVTRCGHRIPDGEDCLERVRNILVPSLTYFETGAPVTSRDSHKKRTDPNDAQ